MTAPRLMAVTWVGGGHGAAAIAGAVAVAAAIRESERRGRPTAAMLLDTGGGRPARTGLVATEPARKLREQVSELAPSASVAPRGHLCVVRTDRDPLEALEAILEAPLEGPIVAFVGAGELSELVRSLGSRLGLAVIQADASVPASLLTLAFTELRAAGVPMKARRSSPGRIPARRALAGLDPGGATGAWARRTVAGTGAGALSLRRPLGAADAAGQALPLVLGLIAALLVAAFALVALGGAATAKGRAQRAVDLAALAAARSMRDDFPRLFIAPDAVAPRPLAASEYRRRAVEAAREAAERNDLPPQTLSVRFRGHGRVPLRVSVSARPQIMVGGEASGRTRVAATAALEPPESALGPPEPMASGGGYSGPLAYRQGKPMRPDVAAAFDRLAAAASQAGLGLTVNSGFRSDAEQARLFAANPDPRWVAPPGRSLHRCATELDLGPPGAYGWLAENAGRFGFERRYPWEPWHYGFVRGPAPCSAMPAGPSAKGRGDGGRSGAGGIPGFVPSRFRASLARASARHDVSAHLLAAQLMAESNFNPGAVSPAGALGIAQFMPATAAAYGLRDPFDPEASIDAQARLMSDLLGRFGSARLALAAYNAGPAPIEACRCVPPYPETQAYVARIIGLLGGLDPSGRAPVTLDVRLVR